MIDRQHFERIAVTLPFLTQPDASLAREFMQRAYLARIPAGSDVFSEGDDAASIALLLSGAVRVYKIGASGREITLYRFGHGESCILTANAILSRQSFPAIATVEEDAEAAMVGALDFRDWINRYEPWRNFVFDLFSQRLAIVLDIVEEVVFRRMDTRLAALLLQAAQTRNPVLTTHQELAAELGSAREVVSRILEDFSAQGFIRTSRGSIEIVDRPGLQAVAAT